MHNIDIYAGQRPLFAFVQQFQLHLRSAVFPTQNKRDICQIHYISGCTTLYNVQISKCLANSRAIFADCMTLMKTSSLICLAPNADVAQLCTFFTILRIFLQFAHFPSFVERNTEPAKDLKAQFIFYLL